MQIWHGHKVSRDKLVTAWDGKVYKLMCCNISRRELAEEYAGENDIVVFITYNATWAVYRKWEAGDS
jgi:hypothetical protein